MTVDALGVSSPNTDHHPSANGHTMAGEGIRPTSAIEQTLEQLLQSLLEMGILVRMGTGASDVQESALSSTPGGVASRYPGGLMGRKVSQTMEQLAKLYSYSDTVHDVMIPLEVINFVDQGKNPHMYTREFIERVAGENMYTNGMLSAVSVSPHAVPLRHSTLTIPAASCALQDYRDILTSSLGDAFPELVSHIRATQHPASTSTCEEGAEVKRGNGTHAMDGVDAHLGSSHDTRRGSRWSHDGRSGVSLEERGGEADLVRGAFVRTVDVTNRVL
ncbi:BQ2448_3516 [Microbotryum intermedium]|uniref:Mediator of RNA polymerase II transcription subunit 10 n=1 Tax=Microbotryum intermedium TaxID=269621 RepID=A0A238FFU9_9BASI|nr:BQ2448_3516 [Microbotryum intermedium]